MSGGSNRISRPLTVFLLSVLALGLFVLSTPFAVRICRDWHGLIVGAILSLIAIFFHCMGGRHKVLYFFSFLLNSVANGFSASAYYRMRSVEPNVPVMLKATLPAAAILALVCLLLILFPRAKKGIAVSACCLTPLLTVILAVLWIRSGKLLDSFGFFCLLICFYYLCVYAVTVGHAERQILRDLSFGSFGTYVLITLVVIFILSEGEILDGLDFDLGSKGTKGAKKQK